MSAIAPGEAALEITVRPRPRSMVAFRGIGNDAWFSARLRDMDIDRGKLAEAITRSSTGGYQPV